MDENDRKQTASTTPQDERREQERVSVAEDALLRVSGHGLSFKGLVLDLSNGGCKIQAPVRLPGGGLIRVEITFAVNGQPFRMGGAIRWSDGKNMGIQFVRVSPEQHTKWTRVLGELQALVEDVAQEIRAASLPPRDAELTRIVDANFADAARRAGPWLVCRVGCTQCCQGAFAISPLDALRLRIGMQVIRAEDERNAEAVEERAHAWITKNEADFPGDCATGILGASADERIRFENFANDEPCPALNPAGFCDLYSWRPLTCRVFGPPVRAVGEDGEEGLGHCELCFKDASPAEVAACEMPVPHELEDELLQQIGESGETVVAYALLK